jgi:hypothetical protein
MYEGDYENGVKKGQGCFIWQIKDKVEKYVGSFNYNVPNGYGVYYVLDLF